MKELIEFKKNIIAWYPIKNENSVLQIGKDTEISKELKTKTNKVTTVENVSEIKDKYDYITLIGALENLNIEQISKLLKSLKEHLTENGKMLIAMKNKFGLKYWTGEKFDINSNAFETVVKSKHLGLNKIKEILNTINLKYKFYYPLPDYNFTNVIFTDEKLPSKDSIDARDINFSDDEELIVFSEREAYKQIIEQDTNMFPFFANSYFIEVSNKESFENIKYVSYGNTRKENYRIKTVIRENEVYKNANNEKAISHIENIARNIKILDKVGINCLDKFENQTIISRYLKNAVSYDELLIKEYKQSGLDKTIQKIKDFKKSILDKLVDNSIESSTVFEKYDVEVSQDLKNKMHFTKNGIIDLIFQNCLVENNVIYAYDQEWFEENVPIEFILYRAIVYFTELKSFEDINKIFEELEIKEYLNVFEKLEEKIQKSILDEHIWQLHTKSILSFAGFSNIIENYNNQIIEANKHSEELEKVIKQYIKQIEELNERILQKDAELENYANELRAIANSISWKITKPIRKISGALHHKK